MVEIIMEENLTFSTISITNLKHDLEKLQNHEYWKFKIFSTFLLWIFPENKFPAFPSGVKPLDPTDAQKLKDDVTGPRKSFLKHRICSIK